MRQGDTHFLVIFKLVLENVIEEINMVNGVTPSNTVIRLLTYVDNLAELINNV